MATLKDIARKAGVSVATVSRILNGNHDYSFSRETTERIRAYAEEMGYKPGRRRRKKAAAEKTKQLLHIALVVWYPEEREHEFAYYRDIRMGIEKQCGDKGISFSRYYTADQFNQDPDAEKFDGLLAVGKFSGSDIEKFAKKTRHIVFVDSSPDPLRFDSVVVDFFAAVEEVVTYLMRRGHRSIGYIGKYEYAGLNREPYPDFRKESFRLITRDRGIFNEACVFVTDEPTPSAGYAIANRLANRSVPDAFIVFSDTVALGVLSAFQESGIRVPEDVSIVSFDDLPFARYTFPSLTTVKIYTDFMGQAAVDLLHEKVTENRKMPKKRSFPTN